MRNCAGRVWMRGIAKPPHKPRPGWSVRRGWHMQAPASQAPASPSPKAAREHCCAMTMWHTEPVLEDVLSCSTTTQGLAIASIVCPQGRDMCIPTMGTPGQQRGRAITDTTVESTRARVEWACAQHSRLVPSPSPLSHVLSHHWLPSLLPLPPWPICRLCVPLAQGEVPSQASAPSPAVISSTGAATSFTDDPVSDVDAMTELDQVLSREF